ncbi:MAG: hypothetical protein LDL55_08625 [Armatimonadetes bacterium]|nr:hypothetical protein [Armatimonadota bacterium]
MGGWLRTPDGLRPAQLGWQWLRAHAAESAAVVLSLCVASGVVGFALGLGGSLQRGIRAQALENLGRVGSAMVATVPVPIRHIPSELHDASPAVLLAGSVQAADSASPLPTRVTIVGLEVDSTHRFFGLQGAPGPGECWLAERAANRLRVRVGDDVLAGVPRFANSPAEAWFRRTETDASLETVRLTVTRINPDQGLGSFSLQTGSRRTPTLVLSRSDASLAWSGAADRWNALLSSEANPEPLGRSLATSLPPSALGVQTTLSRQNRVGFVHLRLAPPERENWPVPVHPYSLLLADSVSGPTGRVAYATAACLDLWPLPDDGAAVSRWLATRLGAREGDPLQADFLAPNPDGTFRTVRAKFRVARIYDERTWLGDPGWTPPMEGLADAARITDWKASFPFDPARVTDDDERYWREHRAAPKLIVGSAAALRHGLPARPHSLLIVPKGKALDPSVLNRVAREAADPSALAAIPLRRNALASAEGSSDFRALFAGMAAVVAMAGLVLAGSSISLSLHRRRQSLGVALAMGVDSRCLRTALRMEICTIGVLGASLGALGAACSLSAGAPLLEPWLAAVAPGVVFRPAMAPSEVLWAVLLVAGATALVGDQAARALLREAPLRLLRGGLDPATGTPPRKRSIVPWAILLLGGCLALPGGDPTLRAVGGLLASAAAFGAGLRRTAGPIRGVLQLALASAAQNRRSLALQAGLASVATCLVGVLASFASGMDSQDRIRAATGGTQLSVQLAVGLPVSPATESGRRRLGFDPASESLFRDVGWHELPLAEGDDAGCLNAARPVRPGLVGLPPELLGMGRFRLAKGRIVPGRALIDAETAQWILHVGLLQPVQPAGIGRELIVSGLLEPSILAGYVVVPVDTWESLFPEGPRNRWFLLEVPNGAEDRIAEALRRELADFGPEVATTESLWKEIAAVQRRYLEAFLYLSLAAAFLVAFGSATTTARRVLSRRSETALMQAVGLSPHAIVAWLGLEAWLPAMAGAAWGAAWSVAATWPAPPWGPLAATLAAAIVTGLGACVGAAWALRRYPVLQSLRSP